MGGDGETDAWGRRLAALALAWLAGVALQLQERVLLPWSHYALIAAAGVLALAIAWRRRRLFLLALVGVAALGFAAAGGQGVLRLAEQLPAGAEGEDVVVVGTIAGLPLRTSSGLRFRFEVEQAQWRGAPVQLPRRLALGWYSGFHEDAVLTQPQTELRAGQRWRFSVRLRRPHGNLNPHGFDYELWLFEQGIRATGTVRDVPVAQRLADAAGHPVERLRQRLRDAIEAKVGDRRAAGVLAALAVGDQAAIEREDWDLFRNTGVAHLMSISGLHVTMFAWLAGGLIGWAWRRSTGAMLWLPAPLAARWGGLAAACAYAVFCGWGVPAQRTVWMLALVTLLAALGVHWSWALVLLSAAVLVTAFDPWALLQPGFWLSFAAVGLLMASGPAQPGSAARPPPAAGWRGLPARLAVLLRGGLRTQVVATLGLTPLGLLLFQQVSLIGLAANLVAIPLVTLLVTPLALLGAIAAPLWQVGVWVLRGLVWVLQVLAAVPGAVWVVPAAPAWAQAAGLLGAALLVLPLPWRVRLLALPLALPLLAPPLQRPAPGHFELLAVDVGQGTAVLVRTRAHLLVYDAGPQYARDSDAGRRVLLPLLRARGEHRIDTLLLSHRDSDHVGGAGALQRALPIGQLLSSLETDHPLRTLAVDAQRCVAGMAWTWDGVSFEVLQPPESAYRSGAKSNALSCVLKVSAGDAGALLTGDIERDQEALLVATQAAALRSDVLVVPHHGSKTSSTAAFLAAVQPRTALVQAGYRNRFGHPAPEVLERYRTLGIRVLTSPRCGAWRWASDGPPEGVCERDAARRYWHHLSPQDDD